jgi:hypothetical protein
MNARQQKVVARFGQVLTFLDANTTLIPPSAVAGQRQLLTGALSQITGFVQDQVVKGQESVLARTLSSARIALRDTYMRQLSAVGQHFLTGKKPTDPSVPNGVQIFALPATRTNALTLIASATAMVTAATPYESVFTANGVNLDAVTAGIQALQAAVNANDSAKRTAKGATQGIVAQVKAGQGAVHMMDVVIRPLLSANKPLLTQWESVKRAAGGQNTATPTAVPVTTLAPITPGSATPAATSAASTPSATSTTSQPATGTSPAPAAA